MNKCRVAPVNVKVDTDNDNNMEAIKPKPLEGIREQNIWHLGKDKWVRIIFWEKIQVLLLSIAVTGYTSWTFVQLLCQGWHKC